MSELRDRIIEAMPLHIETPYGPCICMRCMKITDMLELIREHEVTQEAALEAMDNAGDERCDCGGVGAPHIHARGFAPNAESRAAMAECDEMIRAREERLGGDRPALRSYAEAYQDVPYTDNVSVNRWMKSVHLVLLEIAGVAVDERL